MIVIEGTDNLGKTTLANALIEQLNACGSAHTYMHLSKLPESFDPYYGYLPLMSVDTVWDRFYHSRYAYGMAMQNQAVPTPHEMCMLQAHLFLVPCYTVMVTVHPDSQEWFMDTWDKSRDQMYTAEDAWKVNLAYRRGMERHEYHVDFYVSMPGPYPAKFAQQIVVGYAALRRHHNEIAARHPAVRAQAHDLRALWPGVKPAQHM